MWWLKLRQPVTWDTLIANELSFSFWWQQIIYKLWIVYRDDELYSKSFTFLGCCHTFLVSHAVKFSCLFLFNDFLKKNFLYSLHSSIDMICNKRLLIFFLTHTLTGQARCERMNLCIRACECFWLSFFFFISCTTIRNQPKWNLAHQIKVLTFLMPLIYVYNTLYTIDYTMDYIRV